jgi:hypothetical protein
VRLVRITGGRCALGRKATSPCIGQKERIQYEIKKSGERYRISGRRPRQAEHVCTLEVCEMPQTRAIFLSSRTQWLKCAGAVLLCSGLSSCTKPKGADYFPELSAGSRYEYLVEYRAQGGVVQRASMTIIPDGEETIAGKKYHKSIATYVGIPGLDQQTYYERQMPAGFFVVDAKHKDMPEYLGMPLPVGVGSSWVAKGPDAETSCQAIGLETVDTPNETFPDCLKITFKTSDSSGSSEGVEYYASHVGLVKNVFTTVDGVRMTLTLEKHHVSFIHRVLPW